MQKLTKEQADIFLNLLCQNCGIDHDFSEHKFTMDFIKSKLKQITEKQLPVIRAIDHEDPTNNYSLSADANRPVIWVESDHNLDLTYDQFIKYTENCNKIVEWIKEQQ